MQITFKTRYFSGGKAIGAVAEDGTVVAEWVKITTRVARGTGSYDAHRVAKGDLWNIEDSYEMLGEHDAVLAAARAQLPKALVDAKWDVHKLNADDHFAVFDFLEGLHADGCCWYGNTPAKTVAACKKAIKTFAVTL